MLKLIVKAGRDFNNDTQEFVYLQNDVEICLEHSLVSISKWESKWHKPFLIDKPKSNEELLDYIKCMTISQNVPDLAYRFLKAEQFKEINAYIADPMTATTFHINKIAEGNQSPYKKPEIMTSEIIYYHMFENNIPMECQKWHLNRLITLIRVCNNKNSIQNGKNKMNKRDTLASNRALNEARRAKLNSKG